MEEQDRKKVSVFEDDEIPYEVRMKHLIEDKKLVNHKIEAGNKFYSRMLKNARRERKNNNDY